jgi:hypothetical protein
VTRRGRGTVPRSGRCSRSARGSYVGVAQRRRI